ncbi:MAG: hypothetical protein ACPG6R_11915 [Aequoribacter sp.]|uniref:hypothetical protein n=1 Tax=Aequoribacter sp. TaxID=2847771 RepID=UPI003C38D8A5
MSSSKGGGSVRQPDVPDPVDAINAQAAANRVDTVNPFSSTRYVSNEAPVPVNTSTGKGGGTGQQFIPLPDGGVRQVIPGGTGPRFGGSSPEPFGGRTSSADFTQITEFSPELNAVFNRAVGSALGGPDDSRTPQRLLPSALFDTQAVSPDRDSANFDTFAPTDLDSSRLEQSIFDRSTSLLDPQLAQRERSLRQNLADRGLPEGSEAYNTALNFELDQANRARADAALGAVQAGQDAFNTDRAFDFASFANERDFAGNQEQIDRAFDTDSFEADRNFQQQLNQQDFNNRLTLDEGDRSFFLNNANLANARDQIDFGQIASLLGLSQGSGNNIAPIDVQGAINNASGVAQTNYANSVANANSQRASLNNNVSAGASILAALLA